MKNQAKQILITEDTLVADIQETFTGFYPFLKIEFCKKNNDNQLLQKPKKILPQECIKKITNAFMPAKLNVDDNRTIAQIETDCMQLLGLCVQFSRKSGNIWNLITLTDNWTLEDQNNAGKFISSEMKTPNVKE
ncbi:MAG: hypothetical protein ABI921_04600 [Panacibacter sp.]